LHLADNIVYIDTSNQSVKVKVVHLFYKHN